MAEQDTQKLSQVPDAEAITGNEKLTGIQAGENKNISLNQIKAYTLTGFEPEPGPAGAKGDPGNDGVTLGNFLGNWNPQTNTPTLTTITTENQNDYYTVIIGGTTDVITGDDYPFIEGQQIRSTGSAWAIQAIGLPAVQEFPQGVNLYDKAKAIPGYFVGNDGNIIPNGAATWTGYVPVKELTYYAITRANNGGVNNIAAYDANKQKIGNTVEEYTYDVYTREYFRTPAGAHYVGWTLTYGGNGSLDGQLQEGKGYTAIEDYQGAKKIVSINGLSVTAFTDDVVQGVKKMSSKWQGKTLGWFGHSIPDKGGYPEIVAQNIGFSSIDNEALESSYVRRTLYNGNPIPGGTAKSLSSTRAELSADGYSGATLDNSYETKLFTSDADLYIFEHGFNDRTPDSTNFAQLPATPDLYSRNTFIGAMNYVIRELLKVKPRARFAFITHHTNQYPELNQAVEVLANFWCAPCLQLYKKTGFTTAFVNPVTGLDRLHEYMTDGIHPFTDLSHGTSYLLADIITKWIQNEVF